MMGEYELRFNRRWSRLYSSYYINRCAIQKAVVWKDLCVCDYAHWRRPGLLPQPRTSHTHALTVLPGQARRAGVGGGGGKKQDG